MPLGMPESVLVRFKGKMQDGITLRDLVNAIPYYAITAGLLTVEKKGKKNVFSGRILEIEGLPDLKVEQAFELSDAAAGRPDRHGAGVHGANQAGERQGGRCLSLHELRPDSGVCGSGGNGRDVISISAGFAG
jgi:hypothetical protein